MIYTLNINTNLKIQTLQDLVKLKPFLEDGTLKINKSQLARELGKDRRTIHKYINGYEKPKTRKRSSNLDEYYDIIQELLSETNQQIFYYKSILWQYLVDNHDLDCAESSFRRYISKHAEFQQYFNQRKKHHTSNQVHIRYETAPAKQAQLDWKESIPFTLKTGETIEINVLVLLLSYSRYRVYRLSLSKTQDVLFALLDQSFEILQGIPKELLTDNMKTVMDQPRTEYQSGKVNIRFQQFADDYGFKVKPCIAGRPQTKAKVEAPMKILDEIRAYNGLLSYTELHELVTRINNRVNSKINKGTGR
ncbi:MAG: IS21 family transposase, partial [Clostridiales bacterium]|nr:IS21 family transposase [Clostridiales bacterium]